VRHLVEHAHFAVEAVRVVPRQAEGEGAGAQVARALEQRREQRARRAVDGKRRAVVLGNEEAVEAGAVGGGRELELVLVDLGRRSARGFDPVEDAELHCFNRNTCGTGRGFRLSLGS
jgi:hypothetical protein